MKKKGSSITLRALLALAALTFMGMLTPARMAGADTAAPATEKPVVRVLNWATEYIDVDPGADPALPIAERSPTLRSFAEKFDCAVSYDEYDSEVVMFRNLANMPRYYDVVITASEYAQTLKKAGRLAPLTAEDAPNRVHVPERFSSVSGLAPEDFAPYLVGTTGIAYRMDLVGREIRSWKDYFEPDPALKGRIGTLNMAYMLCFGMQYLGIDIHTRDREEMKRAGRLFLDLKRNGFIGRVTSQTAELKEGLQSGELAMTIQYSGSTFTAARKNPDIRYAIPAEGGEFYIDCMVLLADAPHPALGKAFINHILSPEIHAAIGAATHYVVPNKAAIETLSRIDSDYFNNPATNIPEAVMDRIEILENIDEEAMRDIWDKIFG